MKTKTRAVRIPRASAPARSKEKSHIEGNIEAILRSEEAERRNHTRGEKVASLITRFCGTTIFLWAHVVFFGLWLLGNVVVPAKWRWDPPPYPELTVVVSLEAIFLSTFILIAENKQAALDERRAHLDLQINLLAEQENTKMLILMEAIAARLGVSVPKDGSGSDLSKDIKPDEILRQLDKRLEKAHS